MNKGLKKIIILITFIFSIFTLNPLMAEQAEEPIQSNVETEMEDVSKRLMLSIFGKQALSWYDVETDINYVDEIADSEIYLYTQPFNKNNFSLIRSYIIISLTIGFIMFAIYMFWITKEGILKTQQSGTFLGSNWNTMFTVTKLGLVILLMFPIYTPYSIGHMMIFKITGYSNVISKDISSTIISNQPKTYATTKFPASSGKKTTTEAILKFATCVKASGNDGNVQFNFIEEGNKLKSETFVEDCSLKIVFGMDNSTQEVIEQNKKIKDLLGFNIDFNKLQIKMLENLLKEVLKDSDEYANTLFLPENTSYNEDAKYLLENSEFRNYSLEYATNPILLENWEANCDQLKNYSTLNSNKELTLYEKEQYMFLASRCLSHSVVKKLVYPTQINDFSKYLKTQNYLDRKSVV